MWLSDRMNRKEYTRFSTLLSDYQGIEVEPGVIQFTNVVSCLLMLRHIRRKGINYTVIGITQIRIK